MLQKMQNYGHYESQINQSQQFTLFSGMFLGSLLNPRDVLQADKRLNVSQCSQITQLCELERRHFCSQQRFQLGQLWGVFKKLFNGTYLCSRLSKGLAGVSFRILENFFEAEADPFASSVDLEHFDLHLLAELKVRQVGIRIGRCKLQTVRQNTTMMTIRVSRLFSSSSNIALIRCYTSLVHIPIASFCSPPRATAKDRVS